MEGQGNGNFEVIILFDGYSRMQNGEMLANCTCTLIKGPPHVIVDTMTSWDGPKIMEALAKHGLNCDDIDFVVNTHGHSDHIGCNYLFPKAIHIVGFSISHRDRYFNHDFESGDEYLIHEKIKIIPTPGHTMQDVSVIVQAVDKGIIAITGDLFENENDLHDDSIWKNAGSDSETLQKSNREKILKIANVIIPGHGGKFEVKHTSVQN